MKLQLFLLLYSIKNSLLKLITICFSFFLPISGILGLLFALILADTATGIWKAKHLKQEITSRKLSAIISKLLLYELCVILFFLIDYFILNQIILVFFSVPLMLTKVLALVLASIEIMSISENWRIVKGVNLWQSAKLLFTRAIDIKNDINKLK
jgi:Zn-dependent protease with chaperone function